MGALIGWFVMRGDRVSDSAGTLPTGNASYRAATPALQRQAPYVMLLPARRD